MVRTWSVAFTPCEPQVKTAGPPSAWALSFCLSPIGLHIRRNLFKPLMLVRCWRLTPIIPATQEAEIRRTEVQSQPGQIVRETQSENTHHKKGLVEWLKV
jgi:hypothetical protein